MGSSGDGQGHRGAEDGYVDVHEIARVWHDRLSASPSAEDGDSKHTPPFRFGGLAFTHAAGGTMDATARGEGSGSGNEESAGQIPMCKHLLASVLAEECPGFFGGGDGGNGGGMGQVGGDFGGLGGLEDAGRGGEVGASGGGSVHAQGSTRKGVVQRWVSTEEKAGWAAGWSGGG